MSVIVSFMVAIAGALSWVAVYHALLAARRQSAGYKQFAAIAGSIAAFTLADAAVLAASSTAAAELAVRVEIITFFALGSLFWDFGHWLAGLPRPRFTRTAYAVSTLAVVLAAAGALTDPAFPTSDYDWSLSSSVSRPRVSLLGSIFVGFELMLIIVTAGRIVTHSRGRLSLSVAGIATLCASALGIYDLIQIAVGRSPFPLTGVFLTPPMLAWSYVLIRRLTEADADLAERTHELSRSYKQLERAQAELVKTNQLAALGELSAVVAHELRPPLFVIEGAVEALREPNVSITDSQRLLALIDQENDRLNRLVSDLTAYAKPMSPGMLESVDLADVCARVVSITRETRTDVSTVEFDVSFDRGLSPEAARVLGDESLLRHALANLVDSGLDAMPDGGKLVVRCEPASVAGREAMALSVSDTGEPMDTLMRQRIRDPFFATRLVAPGLGLAIVDRVARTHGGSVGIESRHGRGTTVTLTLPRDGPLPEETETA